VHALHGAVGIVDWGAVIESYPGFVDPGNGRRAYSGGMRYTF